MEDQRVIEEQVVKLQQEVKQLKQQLVNVECITASEQVREYLKRARRAKVIAKLMVLSGQDTDPFPVEEFVQNQIDQKVRETFQERMPDSITISDQVRAEAFVAHIEQQRKKEQLWEKKNMERYHWETIFETMQEHHGIKIWKYLENEPEVLIPPQINGLPVETIGDRTFCDLDFVKMITVADSVSRFGNQVFARSGLEQIDLPSRLLFIGDEAFSQTKIQRMILPDSVTMLGTEVFEQCRRLEKVRLSAGLLELGEKTFGECQSLREVEIGSGIRTIGKKAFMGCIALRKLDIPINVREIDKNAFLGCMRIKLRISEHTTKLYEDSVSTIFGSVHQGHIIYCHPGSKAMEYANRHGIETRPYEAFEEDVM